MKLKITFNGAGGPLDSYIVPDGETAARTLVYMIEQAAELHPGDSFTVEESD